jgi:hypothetical protein
MNGLLWLVNHPLWGNVVGLPTSWNPDTPEGLESRLSVEIHRIPVELPHLTKLEPEKLRRTQTDSRRASALELLWGLLEPRLSLYSTRMNLGALYGTKPHSLHTFCQGEHVGIYWRIKAVLWPMIGCMRPTCQAARACNLARQPSLLLALPLGIGFLEHRLFWTRWQNNFWKCANTWPASQGDVAGWPHFGSVEPVLCATSFPHVILSVTMPYFGYNEDMHGFWSIWYFSIIRCFWNGRSIKLVELVSNKHISSRYWMKCRYVDDKYIHFMTVNIGERADRRGC